ncbi:uncharacterized protein LOC134209001 [Armigeres subalbatus]|uniref:uncharacterized protein LOC134209001 n=1 Tax=Armigeres subalbatus TaxID=124917 RepID=UPI002ECFE71F
MDAHGRLFLISSFAVSFTLCVASQLMQDQHQLKAAAAAAPPESHFRLVSDGTVLILHFIYLVRSRDSELVNPVESFRFILATNGPQLASAYVYIQFFSSVIGNHYMTLCACDIIVEYVDILLEHRFRIIATNHHWRRSIALGSNLLLTVFNCCSIHWTTPSYCIYMKVLFISFWMLKIWLKITSAEFGGQDLALPLLSTIILLMFLIAIKELKCFPSDIASANQTILLPLYEHLIRVKCPELPIIVSCYYSGSMNSYFLALEPSLVAAQLEHLPCVFKLFNRDTNSPVLLLVAKFVITSIVVGYLKDDYDLLGTIWNVLLLMNAFVFDCALMTRNCHHAACSSGGKLQQTAKSIVHLGFQLANIGWIYHRMTGFAVVVKFLLLVIVVSKVVFKLFDNGVVIAYCINTLKMECHSQPSDDFATDKEKKDLLESLV